MTGDQSVVRAFAVVRRLAWVCWALSGCTTEPGDGAPPPFEEAAVDPAAAPRRLDAALARIAMEVQPEGSKFVALRAATAPTVEEAAWPSGEVARLGLVFAVRRSQPIERGAWQTLQVGRIVWDGTTRSASLDRFDAAGEGSTRLLGEISQALSRWMRGENADVVVPAAASRFLDADITGATTVTRAGPDATGASSTPGAVARVVRRVQTPSGAMWLLWEDLPGGGILGVFPDVDPKAPTGPQDGIVAPTTPDGPPQAPMSRAPPSPMAPTTPR